MEGQYLYLIIQTIQILSTAFFNKIQQILVEPYIYSKIHHTLTHLIVALLATLQNIMEEH